MIIVYFDIILKMRYFYLNINSETLTNYGVYYNW